MRSLARCAALFLAASLLFLTTTPAFGELNIKLIEEIEFSSDAKLPSTLRSFCVTEDNLIIIPDKKNGNIKIYEQNGKYLKLAKILGRKGFGIDELAKPTFCFYNRNQGKFGVIDYGKGEFIIYDRTKRLEFQRIYTVSCLERGYDIQLNGNLLIISGYKVNQNGKPYDLYYFKLDDLPIEARRERIATVHPTFLLPSYMKYGLNYPQEYYSKLLVEDEISSIGTMAWFDVQGEYIYFAWEGDLAIFKISVNSTEPLTIFGERTPRYIKPHVTNDARRARRNKDYKTAYSEMVKMSYIRNIFASSKYVMVILDGPRKRNEESNFWVQFYTLDGLFLNEVSIRGPIDWLMQFDKDKDILYSIYSKGKDAPAYLMKYKILE